MYAPAAVSNYPNQITVYVCNLNGGLSTRWWSDRSGWSDWSAVNMRTVDGGVLTVNSGPAAISKREGQIDLFVRGLDNALWTKWYNEREGWSDWGSLGGVCTSGPGVATRQGQIHVFVQNTDGGLSTRGWNEHTGWSNWDNLPNLRRDARHISVRWRDTPAAHCSTEDTISVYVFSTDQILWQRWWSEAHGWHGWELQDKFDETPQVTSAPAVAKRRIGGTDLFACGLSDELRARSFIGGPPDPWTPWGSLGGKLTSAPAVVSKVPGQLDVFARGTDGALWTKWYNEREGWSEWGSLGGSLFLEGQTMSLRNVITNQGTFYAITSSGELLWSRDMKRDGSSRPDGSGWDARSGSQIGVGWHGFLQVFSGGNGIIYAITSSGELLWYRDVKGDGTSRADGSGWDARSGSQIGVGWHGFSQVFSGGNGIIYAIKPTGELLWYRDVNGDGTSRPDGLGWDGRSGSQIGVGWHGFLQVFSGGNGIIYAIKPTGELLWYRDVNSDGTSRPDGSGWDARSGSQIGVGWHGFSQVFSGGDGIIYAIKPTGELLWYRDVQGDGTSRSDGSGWDARSGSQIGVGWHGFS